MIGGRSVLVAALLSGSHAGFAVARAAPQAPDQSPAQSPDEAPTPLPARPITESIDRAVEAYLREHGEPCTETDGEGTPCFPVSVEAGPVFSVAESLRNWKPDNSPGPESRVPTTQFGTPIAGVGFDPVCAGKSILKALRSQNDTYYVYRVWDTSGEYALLREQPLEPGAYTATLLRYELVERIRGECRAIATWRKARREAVERNRSRREDE